MPQFEYYQLNLKSSGDQLIIFKESAFWFLNLWSMYHCNISGSEWDIFFIVLKTLQAKFYTFCKIFEISCMSAGLLVAILSYWDETNVVTSQVLDVIFFWDLLEAFFLFLCWSVFLLIYIFNEIRLIFWCAKLRYHWHFLGTYLRCWYTSSNFLKTSSLWVSLFVALLNLMKVGW